VRVFASVPLILFAFAESQGLDRDELYAIAQIAPSALDDPDQLVDYEILVRVWDALLARFPGEPLGLRYVSLVRLEALGVVGYAIQHAKNGHQALAFWKRFSRLADPHLRVAIEPGEGVHRLILDHEPRVTAMVEPLEMMVLGSVRLAAGLVAREVCPESICFRHPRRHPIHLYEEAVGPVPIRFEAPFDGVVFPSEVLDLPIAAADARIAGYLERHAEALLEQVDDATAPLDARVRMAIDARLLSDEARPAAVARALGMSVRSLQRGLAALDTSFSAELDRARRERACLLLRRPELTVAEIAFMLGYAEPRVFHRSFRRWTGQTPTGYRRAG
jgi:AraC-like DNA-binding protein